MYFFKFLLVMKWLKITRQSICFMNLCKDQSVKSNTKITEGIVKNNKAIPGMSFD